MVECSIGSFIHRDSRSRVEKNLHETVWRQMQINQLLESLCIYDIYIKPESSSNRISKKPPLLTKRPQYPRVALLLHIKLNHGSVVATYFRVIM